MLCLVGVLTLARLFSLGNVLIVDCHLSCTVQISDLSTISISFSLMMKGTEVG